jgi:hypothetical protein
MLNQFLTQAGVRSYSTYLRGSRSVSVAIREPGDVITFTPMRNGGNRGPNKGFTYIQDTAFSIPIGSSEEEVGHSAAQALNAAV